MECKVSKEAVNINMISVDGRGTASSGVHRWDDYLGLEMGGR